MQCIWRSHDIVDFLAESLEEQLKAMQRRLSELLLIPDQIQETLMNVAKTMQKFLPPGSLIVSDPVEIAEAEDVDQYDDSYRFDEKFEDQAEEGSLTDDEVDNDELDDGEAAEGGGLEDSVVDSKQDAQVEVEPEPEKENPLHKWPWSSQERNTFKRSNFQGYRSSSMIQNRWGSIKDVVGGI